MFPARAGMSRPLFMSYPSSWDVPRASGDEPNQVHDVGGLGMFPARAGMSRCRKFSGEIRGGRHEMFPARAGMSRPAARKRRGMINVPRASGDEPHP